MVKVKNINGTSKDRYSNPKGYSSWLDYWENNSIFVTLDKCACIGCSNKAKVGAHVRKTNGDNKWYIVPLCYECNKNTEPFNVNEDYLVELNKENTVDLW